MQENNSIGAKAAVDVVDPKKKDIKNGQFKKKYWRITSKEGTRLDFYPVFEMNEEERQVECRYIEMLFTDASGKQQALTFDWLNIYMFVYYTCNEELRLGLAQRYERKVNYIPYDVEIRPSADERNAPTFKRRIELPIDELTMAIARDEAWKMLRRHLGKGANIDPRQFMYKKGRKH